MIAKFRNVLVLVILLALAACNNQPEPQYLPTLAVLATVTAVPTTPATAAETYVFCVPNLEDSKPDRVWSNPTNKDVIMYQANEKLVMRVHSSVTEIATDLAPQRIDSPEGSTLNWQEFGWADKGDHEGEWFLYANAGGDWKVYDAVEQVVRDFVNSDLSSFYWMIRIQVSEELNLMTGENHPDFTMNESGMFTAYSILSAENTSVGAAIVFTDDLRTGKPWQATSEILVGAVGQIVWIDNDYIVFYNNATSGYHYLSHSSTEGVLFTGLPRQETAEIQKNLITRVVTADGQSCVTQLEYMIPGHN